MENEAVFTDRNGNRYTRKDISDKLRRIGADDCEILFIHTDVMFGRPNPALGKKGYLQALYDVLLDLSVDTLILPAFTYSFCNHEDYDVRNSRTSMGALNEYIRKRPEARRSLDPLLSFSVIGKAQEIAAGPVGDHCFGPDSGFDRLHQSGNVKFLFYGADMGDCFTYLHYIEKVLDVPYRFDLAFTGNIIDYDGVQSFHRHSIHTTCGGIAYRDFTALKGVLIREGILKAEPLGDLEATCIAEEDVYRDYCERLRRDLFTFVNPYRQEELTRTYQYGKKGERVTHC